MVFPVDKFLQSFPLRSSFSSVSWHFVGYQSSSEDLVIVLSGLCINLTHFLFCLSDHHRRDLVGKMASDNIQRSYSIIPCFIFVEVSFCVLVFGKCYMMLMSLFFSCFIYILSCDSGLAATFYSLHSEDWIFF